MAAGGWDAHALYRSFLYRYGKTASLDEPQDASYHAEITLSFQEQGEGQLRLSNFGNLAALTGEETFSPALLAEIADLVEEAGYRYVSPKMFETPFKERDRCNGDLFNQLFDYL